MMRTWIIAAVMLASSQVVGQDVRVATLLEVMDNRQAWASDLVEVRNVVVYSFRPDRGGLVRDETSHAVLAVSGITPKTIYALERYCADLSRIPPRPQCVGTLRFKVTLREEHRGSFTIRAAEFMPEG